MAGIKKEDWKVFEYEDLPQEIKDELAAIDAAKARINERLLLAVGEGYKAQHSYKLDFETGKRVFKIAYYKAKVKVKAPVADRPRMSLEEFGAIQKANGRAY
jgi:hypothetical protein